MSTLVNDVALMIGRATIVPASMAGTDAQAEQVLLCLAHAIVSKVLVAQQANTDAINISKGRTEEE